MKQFIFILLMISALWMSGKTSPIVDDIPCTTYNVRTEKVGRYKEVTGIDTVHTSMSVDDQIVKNILEAIGELPTIDTTNDTIYLFRRIIFWPCPITLDELCVCANRNDTVVIESKTYPLISYDDTGQAIFSKKIPGQYSVSPFDYHWVDKDLPGALEGEKAFFKNLFSWRLNHIVNMLEWPMDDWKGEIDRVIISDSHIVSIERMTFLCPPSWIIHDTTCNKPLYSVTIK